MKFLSNIDLQKNEIQNFRVQNLSSAPSNPVVGQHYFDTAENTEFVWNGTQWIDALSQGDYTFQNGIVEGEGRTVSLKLNASEAGDVAFVADADGLKANVDLTGYAKATEAADLAATDTLKEALGKLEAKADEKVVANSDITAGTHTKITYDAKGLVTGGADLSVADIPALPASKVEAMTGYAKATEAGAIATGDSLNEAVGKLEFKVDKKLDANEAIEGATHTKVTYDANGLVTGGADLSESDVPNLDAAKVSTMTNYAKATESRAIATDDKLTDALGKLEYKVDNAIIANAAISGATKTKITFDSKGLVTAGADLTAADIPSVDAAKVESISGYAKATEAADVEATDTLAQALGKLEAKADNAIVANEDITAGTHTKITYDEKGLVTGGADLSEADIPEIGAAKVANLTGYVKATEAAEIAAADTLLGAMGKIQKQLDGKIGLDALAIASESADYLTYSNGEFGANVSTEITDGDTNLVTGDAVHEAIKDHITLADIAIASESTDFLGYDSTTGKISAKAGIANGLATLDANGLVPSTQLPSYVDDVIELLAIGSAPAECAAGDKYFNTTSGKIFTATGANTWGTEGVDPEKDKIYVNKTNDMSYRWSGSVMTQIGADKLKGSEGSLIGDGTTTTFDINHNLGTRNVVFEIFEAASPYEKVYVQVLHTSASKLQVVFSQAPAVGTDYNYTVIAIGA